MTRLFFILIITLSLSACKKYPEDEKRSWKSPYRRLTNQWALYKITDKNDREITDSVIYFTMDQAGPQQSFTYRNMTIAFDKTGGLFYSGNRAKFIVSNLPCYEGSYYQF